MAKSNIIEEIRKIEEFDKWILSKIKIPSEKCTICGKDIPYGARCVHMNRFSSREVTFEESFWCGECMDKMVEQWHRRYYGRAY